MKKSNLKIATSLVLIIIMLFSTFSAAAANEDIYTTTSIPIEEDTTTGDYSDDYWNGYYDGYDDGYNDGWFDGIGTPSEPTVSDKLEYLFDEIMYRISSLFERIKDIIEKLFKIGDYAPSTPVDPEADFIPDGTQATLEGDEEAAALCDEFNALIYNLQEELPEPVSITKKVDVAIEAKDIPSFVQSTVNSIIEQFVIDAQTTNDYSEGDYAYELQYVELFPAGITEATKTVNEDGTTDYKFVLIEEAAYYDGHNTVGVRYIDGEFCYGVDLQHDYAADTLYIEYADLEPVSIKTAEIVYPGATVTAKADAQGRLVAYDINMPVKGTGTAKIMTISLAASLEGYRNEGFVISYNS